MSTRVEVSGVMGNRHIISNDNQKIIYVDQANSFGWAMMQASPYGVFKTINTDESTVEEKPNTADGNGIGYVLLVNLEYPVNIYIYKKENKNFQMCPESKKISSDSLTDYTTDHKPEPSVSTKKMICDQTDKNNI